MSASTYMPASKSGIKGLMLVIVITSIYSCKKIPNSDVKGPVDYSTEQIAVNQNGPVNVYFAGWRGAYPALEFSVYGKNASVSDLTNGTNYIQANSIAISGTDVYVGGNEYSNNHFKALYWKNGNVYYLTDTGKTSFISSMAVSGSDIYFSGYENNGNHTVATYWKNGQRVNLTSGATDAQVNAIAVWGNNVYAAGWEKNGSFEVAKYWKNSIAVNLSNGSSNVEANSIAVWGDDVFVVGDELIPSDVCPQCGAAPVYTRQSRLWKNGALLATAGDKQSFSAVAVSNSGVYVAGTDSARLCYFKNGTPVYITQSGTEVSASAVALWGNDVYIAGYENISGHNVGTYWKNGTPVRFPSSDDNSYLTGLFLQKQ
jgi:hypothetical protein